MARVWGLPARGVYPVCACVRMYRRANQSSLYHKCPVRAVLYVFPGYSTAIVRGGELVPSLNGLWGRLGTVLKALSPVSQDVRWQRIVTS